MTLSRSTVEGLAALCGGIPDLTFTVSTSHGGVLWVAEHPDAQLCVHAFRQAIQHWPTSECHQHTIEAIAFDDFTEMAGILARDGERWFVSPLRAAGTAEVLNALSDLDESIDVVVRDDLDFDVSVVRFAGAGETELDDAAIAAYAACLTEELTRADSRAA